MKSWTTVVLNFNPLPDIGNFTKIPVLIILVFHCIILKIKYKMLICSNL